MTTHKHSANPVDSPGYRERVYEIVRQIPAGRVMTYGQIAYLLGEGYTPRTVGFVMHAASEENTPWHRVINAQGGCSTGRILIPPDKQRRMLEAEGVEFDPGSHCRLDVYQWSPVQEPGSADVINRNLQSSLFKPPQRQKE
ncbi:MAG: MGMT family protein [Pyrinomonadaceae bacterium]